MTDALVPVVETPAVDAAATAEATSAVVPASAGSSAIALPRVIVDAGSNSTSRGLSVPDDARQVPRRAGHERGGR